MGEKKETAGPARSLSCFENHIPIVLGMQWIFKNFKWELRCLLDLLKQMKMMHCNIHFSVDYLFFSLCYWNNRHSMILNWIMSLLRVWRWDSLRSPNCFPISNKLIWFNFIPVLFLNCQLLKWYCCIHILKNWYDFFCNDPEEIWILNLLIFKCYLREHCYAFKYAVYKLCIYLWTTKHHWVQYYLDTPTHQFVKNHSVKFKFYHRMN